MDASGYGSPMELLHGARAPPDYQQQLHQQQQQRAQQLGMAAPARYTMAAPPSLPYTQQQLQQHHYHLQQQQQQQQQQYYFQQYMSHAATGSSPPEFSRGLRGSSPVSEDDDLSSSHSPAATHCGHSPGAWSSQTDSSGYSSPPSDTGGNEWDLLSDMLMEDALTATSVPPAAPSSAYAMGFTKQMHASAYLPVATPPSQQQQQQHDVVLANASLLPATRTIATVAPHSLARSTHSMTPPALIAVVAPSPSPLPAAATNALLSSPSSSPLSATQAMVATTNISRTGRAAQSTKTAAAPVAATPPVEPVVTAVAISPAAVAVKVEVVSAEEQKKLRRRTQIASSVQRHREKKKTLVSSLKHELATLTGQLESMRSQRKALHASAELVEWEERAITQRRKRKQSEEANARMKKALFQQTAFLFGMRTLMMGDMPAPRELEFHDWIHSYTVLSAGDVASRRREYASYFSESKMDLAAKIVLRATDGPMLGLNRSRPYYAQVQLLHDGTRVFADEATVPVAHELTRACYDAGNGQVMKKYTSVFLFEDAGASFESVHAVAWECTKQVGVFWPGAGYTSQALDVVDVPTGEVGGTGSRVYFTDLSADLELLDDVHDASTNIKVESRMLCREQRRADGESVFVWDYVDRDDLYPLPLGAEALAKQAITRKSCGAVVVRKEPGGLISIRSTSIKIFDTTLPPSASAAAKQSDGVTAASSSDAEAIAAMNRRLGLQATEAERKQQKCIRYVYDAMRGAFAAAAQSTSSSE